jgi:hypothetical protein
VTESIVPAVEAAAETEVGGGTPEPVVSEELARRLVEQARTEGLSLIGPGGLLGDLTRRLLETSLEVEMTDHLGVRVNRTTSAATTSTNAMLR